MGENEAPNKSKPSILKKEIKLGWFLKFLLISGSILTTILVTGIIYLNVVDHKKELVQLEKEITNLKYKSAEQIPTSTNPSQIIYQQTPVDSNPVINCVSNECGTKRIARSECELAVCCPIGDKYFWAVNETECRNTQSVVADNERKADEAKREEDIRNYEAEVSMQNAQGKTDCYKVAGDYFKSCNDICDDYSTNLDFIVSCMDECKVKYEKEKDRCDSFYDL